MMGQRKLVGGVFRPRWMDRTPRGAAKRAESAPQPWASHKVVAAAIASCRRARWPILRDYNPPLPVLRSLPLFIGNLNRMASEPTVPTLRRRSLLFWSRAGARDARRAITQPFAKVPKGTPCETWPLGNLKDLRRVPLGPFESLRTYVNATCPLRNFKDLGRCLENCAGDGTGAARQLADWTSG
jgi:hypothetical protein